MFGTTGTVESHDFSGKTDPQIATEVLRAAGVAEPRVRDGLPRLFERYLARLEEEFDVAQRAPTVLPGVVPLLEELRNDAWALGLVTGNLSRGADIKLRAAGLGGWFSFGGFGSDAADRDVLPAFAVRRAEQLGYTAGAVVVIGDTPRDVACGQAAGAHTVGVATGSYDEGALRAAGAHAVLADFSDTGRAVAAITRL